MQGAWVQFLVGELVTVDLVAARDGGAGLGVIGTDASQATELLAVRTEG